MLSDEVMELRRRRLKPTVQPVEMNDLYNRRKGSFDAHKEYVVVDLTSFNDGDERVFSPLTSTTAGSSPPRTLEREASQPQPCQLPTSSAVARKLMNIAEA